MADYATDLSGVADPPPAAGARERILEVSAELFYRDGFRAVGVDTIVARAGVAKTTLYHHFASKDELIVAYLERSDRAFWAWFERALGTADEPRARLQALFDAVAALAANPSCLGCTFQHTAADFPAQEHPGHRAARAHKQAVLARLRELGAQAGAGDPQRLAGELLLIMDGAFASARMFGDEGPAGAAPAAAAAVLAAHLPRAARR